MQPDSWMMKNHLSSAAFINNEPLELPADAQLNWVLENSFLRSDWRMELVHAQEVPSDPEEKSNFCSHSCSSRSWFSQKRCLVNWLQADLPQSFDPYLILALERSITPPSCYHLSTFVIAVLICSLSKALFWADFVTVTWLPSWTTPDPHCVFTIDAASLRCKVQDVGVSVCITD